jgi:hypothetical protein
MQIGEMARRGVVKRRRRGRRGRGWVGMCIWVGW